MANQYDSLRNDFLHWAEFQRHFVFDSYFFPFDKVYWGTPVAFEISFVVCVIFIRYGYIYATGVNQS